MRIISRFKDYYDGVSIYDADDTHAYVRNQEIYTDKAPAKLKVNALVPSSPYGWGHVVIAFCGKLYVLYRVQLQNLDEKYFTNIPEMIDFVEENQLSPKYRYRYHTTSARAKWVDYKGVTCYSRTKDGWAAWCEDNQHRMTVPLQTHLNYKSPVIAIEYYFTSSVNRRIVVNPCLKNYDFAKVVDPYTAFQEIDMFIANQMAEQFDPTANRTDIEIRDSKGFDDRSFKKDSPRPKRSKRK